LEELALTDPLTGLPNRRAIEEWATRQLSGAARYGFSFLVVLADLDHFKAVNDTHGHDAGDAVLKKFAEILKSNSRRSDICGRIGGEEFLFILTHTTQENARVVIERIRAELEAAKFDFDGGNLTVTASFGLAGFEGTQAPDFNRLVSQADAALYAAKRTGRNRIEIAAAQVL
jgi:diguanylate cyclase (GGDEF)-like protein